MCVFSQCAQSDYNSCQWNLAQETGNSLWSCNWDQTFSHALNDQWFSCIFQSMLETTCSTHSGLMSPVCLMSMHVIKQCRSVTSVNVTCCWPVHTLAWLHIVCFHRDQHQWETPTTDRRTASVSGEPKRNRVWKEEEIKKCEFRFEPQAILTHTKWPKCSIVFQRCMYIDCACIHYFYPLFFF